jgi:hypothetical protein
MDETLGAEVIAWIANCRVPEGVLIGQPIELMEWQKREILRTYDNPATTQQFDADMRNLLDYLFQMADAQQ